MVDFCEDHSDLGRVIVYFSDRDDKHTQHDCGSVDVSGETQ